MINEDKISKTEEREVINTVRKNRPVNMRDDPREEEERAPITFGGGTRFSLPRAFLEKIKESDQVAGFVAFSIGRSEDRENYEKAIERGWRPARISKYPELARRHELSPFREREDDDLYKKGGQVAMIRSKKIDDAEKAHYDSEAKRQRYMSDMYKMGNADPRNPRPFADDRKFGNI